MSVAPPTIEMLWESVDPQVALKRFGFADAASTAQWVTAVLAAEWGISVVACERVVLSAGNALAWVTASDQTTTDRQVVSASSVVRAARACLSTDELAGRPGLFSVCTDLAASRRAARRGARCLDGAASRRARLPPRCARSSPGARGWFGPRNTARSPRRLSSRRRTRSGRAVNTQWNRWSIGSRTGCSPKLIAIPKS